MKAPSRLSSVILWSVISAAFIGPGTVTTAVSVGSQHKFTLIWAVLFATVACIVLQEVSARIVIASGLTLGQYLKKKFGERNGLWLQLLIGGSVVLGCAAYEAGNILGAVSGISLLTEINRQVITTIICLCAFLILWLGGSKWISNVMILLVAIMGVAFVALAATKNFNASDVIKGAFTPVVPIGSEMLVLGLIGTTIVPYNIFIGSGISKGQTIGLMRIGLIVSIFIGGLITCAIMFAGSTVDKFDSFASLSEIFSTRVGTWGGLALALGLFAAGFSSSITSPYASSVIASTVFEVKKKSNVRLIWGFVLLTGFAFGISEVKPIPIILAVQALNGLILPLIVLFLFLIINDRRLIDSKYHHSDWYNIILVAILFVVLLIGFNNVDKAISSFFDTTQSHFNVVFIVTVLATVFAVWSVIKDRRRPQP